MRVVLLHFVLSVFSLGLIASGASSETLVTLQTSFEDTDVGSLPNGWRVPVGMQKLGFRARVDRDPIQKSGAIRLTSGQSTPAPSRPQSHLGSVLYSLHASAFVGRNLRLSAQARLTPDGPASRYRRDGHSRSRRRATVWMRFEPSTGPALFFQQEDVDAHRGWQAIRIDAAVPAGTEQVHVGLTLYGDGEAWIDDVQIQDRGDSHHEAARSLTDLGLRNLVALTQLYGTVRYFHPSDGVAGTDWDSFLFDAIGLLESAADEFERATRLESLFGPIAPTLTITSTRPVGKQIHDTDEHHQNIGQDAVQGASLDVNLPDRVLIWDHYGLGTGRDETYVSERRSDETLSAEDYPQPLKSFSVDLGPRTRATVPLAAYANADGTLPPTDPEVEPHPTKTEFLPNYHDRTTRLAAVIVLWSVIEHFFPYFEESECEWSTHLEPLLHAAADLDDRELFLSALQTAVAQLGDGHADVYPFYDLETGRLPLTWQWLDDALIVTNTASRVILRGDRVTGIAGIPIEDYLENLETRISAATPRWKRRRALDRSREGQIGHSLQIQFERNDGSPAETEIEFWNQGRARNWLNRSTLPVFHRWTDEMIYIDTSRATDTQMREWLPQLTKARGVILDMRGYPKGLSTRFLEHLVDHPTPSLQWHVPVTRAPHQAETYVSSSNWTIHPRSPRITCPIALLQDEHAISRAETYLALVRESGVGRSFGSPTAGTNGNSNAVILPGDFRLTFTGMEVRQPDGGRFHGVGVTPDVPIRPTQATVRQGRDEVLEAARSWIRTMRPGQPRTSRTR